MAGGPTEAGLDYRRRALQLARLLEMPPAVIPPQYDRSFHVLAHLSAMPTRADHDERRRYGNEVLANCDRLLPRDVYGNGFLGAIGVVVGTMDTFPAWFVRFGTSNEKLISDYILIGNILLGMKIVGISSLSVGGVGGKMANSAFRAVQGGARSVGEISSAVGGAARSALTGGLVGGLAVAWTVGALAATALVAQQNDIRRHIELRYQNGTLPAALYEKAMGADVPLPERYFSTGR